jgi:cytochrome P450/NADPH-cytochrome P450 reductase
MFSCAMDMRFNSFYQEEPAPFVQAMNAVLSEGAARASRPGLATYLMRSSQAKFDANIAFMGKVAKEVIERRRKNPTSKSDLLNTMINGRDPTTGEGLSDKLIVDNVISFLVAGNHFHARFVTTIDFFRT